MRAFPVLYVKDVAAAATFWQRLDFVPRYSFPTDGVPSYVSFERDGCFMAITAADWSAERYNVDSGPGPTAEMFVYVNDVDELVRSLRDEGVSVLREPEDMPWGERVAAVLDPDGHPVSLANENAG